MKGWGAALATAAAVAMAAESGWTDGERGDVVMHTDLEMLGRFVELPVVPEAATFEMWDVGDPGGLGPTDRAFLALLRYDRAGFERITAMLDEAGPHRGGFRAEARDWLSGEDLAPATRNGDLVVHEGHGARRAAPFEKGGLIDGVALPLSDGEHVLVTFGTY